MNERSVGSPLNTHFVEKVRQKFDRRVESLAIGHLERPKSKSVTFFVFRMPWFSLILTCALLGSCSFRESTTESFTSKNSNPDGICQDLSGTYALFGEALPGMPSHFIFVNSPLTIDVMLGLDLPYSELNEFTEVQFTQGNNIKIDFRGDGRIKSKKLPESLEDRVICDGGKMTILQSTVSHGEGVTARIEIMDTLYLDKDGALIIMVNIVHHNRSLFIVPWEMKEEYGARFRRIEE